MNLVSWHYSTYFGKSKRGKKEKVCEKILSIGIYCECDYAGKFWKLFLATNKFHV
jgi:hypothetical protein